jgi:AraC-like DNA-binding protein
MKPIYKKITTPKDQSFYLNEVVKPYFPDPWHFHPEIEILYIREGFGTKYVGDSISPFYPGDIVIIGSNTPHAWSCNPDYLIPENKLLSSCVCIQFMGDIFIKLLSDIPELFLINEILNNSKRGIQIINSTRDILIRHIEELTSLTGMKRVIGLLTVLDIISISKDIRYLSSPEYKPVIINSEDKARIETIFSYVFKNYAGKVMIKDVASLVNLTPPSFCRFFKSRTKKVFSSFVNEVRIGNSCRMLIEKKYSINQVCFASGFNYLSNFNRQFKKIKGMTPSEFNLKYRNNHFDLIFDNKSQSIPYLNRIEK